MEPIQKYTDPLSWVTGGKWADLTSQEIPKLANTALAPITQGLGKIDKAINPLRRIGIIDQIGDIAEAKPADTIGLVVGSIFSGGALDGAMAGAGGAAGAGAAGVGAADAGTAAAIGAGAADVGTAAGLGSGLLAGTAGTDLGAGALAASLGTTAGATGSIGAAGGFSAAGLGAGATSIGLTGVGNGIGASIGAGAGQVGTGLYGGLQGAAAYGDAGLTGTVGNGFFAMPSAYSSALGEAPTGLYSGLLPGGGMTGTASGALGGGVSGAVDGSAGIGYGSGATATMGGLANSPMIGTVGQFGNALSNGQRAYSAINAMEPQQAGAARAPAAQYRRTGSGASMPIPSALPMMTNPSASYAAMPGATMLPTTSSTYQNLLTNMLTNEMQPPTAGLLGSGSTGSFLPGAGGMMNPSYLIPGMY
ncbi:hypothetical protein AB4Y36_29630 [Paraburkholderia sp. BR10936]|uniref:hypothetical protein n=1 Tax=Paraburkholderia sp. BR10936 TaxID=3236993 RepID=UPI0034D2CA82